MAISPSRPCGICRFCQLGLQNHCLDMRYYGSAMRTPHVQGAFRQEIVIEPHQAHKLADSVSDHEGAMAEPLSVALHAVNRAGPLLGKRVLVTGCGPIGALLIIAARRAGATQIVATDVAPFTLRKALAVGADEASTSPKTRRRWRASAPTRATSTCCSKPAATRVRCVGAFDALRPRGIIVQVGLGGEMTLPVNTIVAKEFDLRGAFRFHEEFATAVALLNQRLGRREAADLGHDALPRRQPRIRARGRPLAGDEGAAQLRLSNTGGAATTGARPPPAARRRPPRRRCRPTAAR